jgi:hypothetical protein
MNLVLAVTRHTLLPQDEGAQMARLGARIVRAVHETEILLCFAKNGVALDRNFLHIAREKLAFLKLKNELS